MSNLLDQARAILSISSSLYESSLNTGSNDLRRTLYSNFLSALYIDKLLFRSSNFQCFSSSKSMICKSNVNVSPNSTPFDRSSVTLSRNKSSITLAHKRLPVLSGAKIGIVIVSSNSPFKY